MVAVDVKTKGGKLAPGIPKPLFRRPFGAAGLYDFSADGQTFFFAVAVVADDSPPASRPFTVVTNWTTKLKK